MIILKDLKIGKSSDFILSDFHPDAMVMFEAVMDLPKVCFQGDLNKSLPDFFHTSPAHPVIN